MSADPICMAGHSGPGQDLRQEGARPVLFSAWIRKRNTSRLLTMTWALCFLAVLHYFSGVSSQGTLTQPVSMSKSLGETVKLSCTKSSGGSWDSRFTWLQQTPGQRPRYVIFGGDGYTTNKGEGIPDRFTFSFSGNVGYLTINNIQAEDEADYYCASWYSTLSMIIFGGGTHLTVLGQEPTPPKLSVYPPSPEEIKTRNKATLVCLMNDFYPGTIQVDWTADGTKITQDVQTAKPTKHGDKYISSSYLTLNSADWEQRNSYTCRVTHEGKSFEESIRPSECRSNP